MIWGLLAGGVVGVILAQVLLVFVDPLDIPDLIRGAAARARGALLLLLIVALALAILYVPLPV